MKSISIKCLVEIYWDYPEDFSPSYGYSRVPNKRPSPHLFFFFKKFSNPQGLPRSLSFLLCESY